MSIQKGLIPLSPEQTESGDIISSLQKIKSLRKLVSIKRTKKHESIQNIMRLTDSKYYFETLSQNFTHFEANANFLLDRISNLDNQMEMMKSQMIRLYNCHPSTTKRCRECRSIKEEVKSIISDSTMLSKEEILVKLRSIVFEEGLSEVSSQSSNTLMERNEFQDKKVRFMDNFDSLKLKSRCSIDELKVELKERKRSSNISSTVCRRNMKLDFIKLDRPVINVTDFGKNESPLTDPKKRKIKQRSINLSLDSVPIENTDRKEEDLVKKDGENDVNRKRVSIPLTKKLILTSNYNNQDKIQGGSLDKPAES